MSEVSTGNTAAKKPHGALPPGTAEKNKQPDGSLQSVTGLGASIEPLTESLGPGQKETGKLEAGSSVGSVVTTKQKAAVIPPESSAKERQSPVVPAPAAQPPIARPEPKPLAQKLIESLILVTFYQNELKAYHDKLQAAHDTAIEVQAASGDDACVKAVWTAETCRFLKLARARLLGCVKVGYMEEREAHAMKAVSAIEEFLVEADSVPVTDGERAAAHFGLSVAEFAEKMANMDEEASLTYLADVIREKNIKQTDPVLKIFIEAVIGNHFILILQLT